jgi:hypothetical protein
MIALAAAIVLGLALPANADGDDAGEIRQLMMATFNKPEAPLTVEPVTVYADVAVAGWSQGEMGGRALLRRQDEKWVLTLCSGDALKEAKSLQHFGLNAEEADAMAKAVIDAEAKLDPTLVAKFATFDGVVMMDGEGHHPSVDGHGSAHKS